LISGVMTGVTAGAMGLIGAAAIAGLRFAARFFAGLRFAAFFLADFFFEPFFFADFFFAAFFFDDFFFATRFFEDFFFAVFLDFFFAAFFFAAMLTPFNVESSRAGGPTGFASHYQASGFASNGLVSRFYAQLRGIAHVKPDYLVGLGPFWCRLDTNSARIDVFARERRAPGG
jgi:hypothetical protein